MCEKVKNFYQRHKGLVWLVIIVILVLIISNDSITPLYRGSLNESVSSQGMVSDGYTLDKSASVSDMPMVPPDGNYNEPGLVPNQDQKIRKNGSLYLEVAKGDYTKTKNEIDNLIATHKGFYIYKNESKNDYNQTDYYTYSITIKFPKDDFDKAVEEFKALGDVKNFQVDASDLTAQYYDTLAYKTAAEQVKTRVQALLDRAQNIEEIITIESKLADLQRQVDEYQRQLTNIDRQTEYSQLSLTVTEKSDYVQSFYAMTGLRELFRNMVNSFDQVFVKFSKAAGFLIIVLVVWLIYRLVKKIKLRKNKPQS